MSARIFIPVIVFLGLTAAGAIAANGALKVTSFPAGAEVWVDGAFTGKYTPMSVSLAEGDHRVEVKVPGDGWQPVVRTVTVIAGNNEVHVTLVPAATQGTATSIYTQWGNSSCIGGSATLARGFAFANHYTHASSEPLCVPAGTPGVASGFQGDLLYALSLQGGNVHPGGIVNNSRIACSLCESTTSPCFQSTGAQSCPSGYAARYRGYLYGGHYSHGGTGRMCVASESFEFALNLPDHGGYVYPTSTQATAGTGVDSFRLVSCAVCCPSP